MSALTGSGIASPNDRLTQVAELVGLAANPAVTAAELDQWRGAIVDRVRVLADIAARAAQLLGLDPAVVHEQPDALVDALAALRQVAQTAGRDAERAYNAERAAREADSAAQVARAETASVLRELRRRPDAVLLVEGLTSRMTATREHLASETNRAVLEAQMYDLNAVVEWLTGTSGGPTDGSGS